jgi:hypothetical protein
MAGLQSLVDSLAPTASVLWSPSKYPEASLGDLVLAMRLVSGPSPRAGGQRASVYTTTLPTDVTITVGPVTAGETMLVSMSGRRFSADVEVGDDVEAARDRLLAALTSNPMIDATIEASGSTAIDVVALEAGDLYEVRAYGPLTLTTNDSSVCKAQFDQVRSEFELQAFSRSRYPMDGAAAVLSRLVQKLELPTASAILEDYGLAIAPGSVIDLTSMRGPEWESRSAITLSVTQASFAAEPTETIQSVGLSIEAREAPGVVTITLE